MSYLPVQGQYHLCLPWWAVSSYWRGSNEVCCRPKERQRSLQSHGYWSFIIALTISGGVQFFHRWSEVLFIHHPHTSHPPHLFHMTDSSDPFSHKAPQLSWKEMRTISKQESCFLEELSRAEEGVHSCMFKECGQPRAKQRR